MNKKKNSIVVVIGLILTLLIISIFALREGEKAITQIPQPSVKKAPIAEGPVLIPIPERPYVPSETEVSSQEAQKEVKREKTKQEEHIEIDPKDLPEELLPAVEATSPPTGLEGLNTQPNKEQLQDLKRRGIQVY